MQRRIRAWTILSVLAAVVAAALPAAAGAGPRADYKHTFSTPVPGASTGSDTQIFYKHPDDPEAKPIPVRQEVFTFPKGTQFDSSVVPDCTASELELQLLGEMACPPDSRIGGGEEGTFMTGFPGAGETPMEIDAFDDGSAFLVLGSPQGFPLRMVTRARRQGRVVTVDAPRMPGGPPDGESALRRVHNVFDARSLGGRAYIRTPSVCPPSGMWTFRARFTFADGVAEENISRMPCRRP
jgi:hypothetical protein